MANTTTAFFSKEGIPVGNTQHRSEQARRNYETAEKKRQQAMKRKALKAKWNENWPKAKTWAKENPKKLVLAAVALVVLALLAQVAVYALTPVKHLLLGLDGQPIGKQDNWLILNGADDGDKPRYYHLADFDAPEGFTLDDFTALDGDVQQDFYYTSTAEDGIVQDVYVSAARNLKAADYVQRLLSFGMHKEAGTPTAGTIAGKDAHYVYLVFDESDTDGEGMAYSCLCIYVDTPQGSAVSAMVNSRTLPLAEVPTEAELLAEAEILLAGLNLVK